MATTNSYPSVPGDIAELRRMLAGAFAGGQIRPPNPSPTYIPNTSFIPSSGTRTNPGGGVYTPPGVNSGSSFGPAYTANAQAGSDASRYAGTPGATYNPYTAYQNAEGRQTWPGGPGNSVAAPNPNPNAPSSAGQGYRAPMSFNDWSASNLNHSTGGQGVMNNPQIQYAQYVAGLNQANPSGAATPDFMDSLNGIFAQNPAGPPPVSIAGLPGLDTQNANAFTSAGTQIANDPRFDSILQQIMGGQGPSAEGSAVSREGVQSDAINRLLDPNSEFYRQITGTYNSAFDQQRATALAQAKEGAGNLTGSGMANTLGTTVNRGLADQQKAVTDALMSALGLETGRQVNMAGLANQGNIATAGNQTQASIANAGNANQAQNTIMSLLSNQGIQGAQLGQQNQQFNAGQNQQNSQYNAGQTNTANTNYFNAGVNRNQSQAEMDQQRNLAQFTAATGLSGQNAQSFMQLLSGLTNTGVGPNQMTQSGGPEQLLQLLPMLS